MGNDGDYRKQVGIDYHPMTLGWRSGAYHFEAL